MLKVGTTSVILEWAFEKWLQTSDSYTKAIDVQNIFYFWSLLVVCETHTHDNII